MDCVAHLEGAESEHAHVIRHSPHSLPRERACKKWVRKFKGEALLSSSDFTVHVFLMYRCAL